MVRFIKLVFHDDILGKFGSFFPSCIVFLMYLGFSRGLKHHAGSFPLGFDIPLVVSLTLDFSKEHSLSNSILLKITWQSNEAEKLCSVLMESPSFPEGRNKGSVSKSPCPESGLEVGSPVFWTRFSLSLEKENQGSVSPKARYLTS